jgi:hypothetical protein
VATIWSISGLKGIDKAGGRGIRIRSREGLGTDSVFLRELMFTEGLHFGSLLSVCCMPGAGPEARDT